MQPWSCRAEHQQPHLHRYRRIYHQTEEHKRKLQFQAALKHRFLIWLCLCFSACSEAGNNQEHAPGMAPRFANKFRMEGDSLLWVASISQANTWMPVPQETLNPSSRIVCLSSVIVAYLEELGLSHAVIAVDDAKYISSVSLSSRIRSGELKSVKPGAQLDVETVLALRPHAVLYYEGGNGEDASMNLLRKRGVRLIPVNSYTESHPLGRAEWLRFMGRLFGKRQQADSLFDQLALAYHQQKEWANRTGEYRPTVFCNAPFGGVCTKVPLLAALNQKN